MEAETIMTPGASGSESDVVARIAATLESDSPTESAPAAPAPEDTSATPEVEAEAPEEQERTAQAEEGSDDGEFLTTAQVSQLLGIEEESILVGDDGALYVKTKIDGMEGRATIPELVKSYQIEGHLTRKSQALSEERKAFEEFHAAQRQEITKRVGEVTALTTFYETQLQEAYKNTDWELLRIQNPAEWSARRQEFADKARALQEIKNTAHKHTQALIAEHSRQVQDEREKRLGEEVIAILDAFPTWRDPAVARREKETIGKFITQFGFAETDVDAVEDHRLLKLVKYAMGLSDKAQTAQVAVKRLAGVPRIQPPGARTSPEKGREETLRSKRIAIKKSGGSPQAVEAFILEKLL